MGPGAPWVEVVRLVWIRDTIACESRDSGLAALQQSPADCRIERHQPQQAMTVTIAGDFGRLIGSRMSEEHKSLAARWLGRLERDAAGRDRARSFRPGRCWTTSRRFDPRDCRVPRARGGGRVRREHVRVGQGAGARRVALRAARVGASAAARVPRPLGAILVTFVEEETARLELVAPSR